jgi:hypothetical protein
VACEKSARGSEKQLWLIRKLHCSIVEDQIITRSRSRHFFPTPMTESEIVYCFSCLHFEIGYTHKPITGNISFTSRSSSGLRLSDALIFTLYVYIAI